MKRLFFSVLIVLVNCLYGNMGLKAEIKLIVTSGIEDGSIKNNIQNSASQLLTMFDEAIFENKSIKTQMKNAQIAPELAKIINELWKSSAMQCPIREVKRNVTQLRTGGTGAIRGYEVRDIPIDLLAAEEDEQEQDLVMKFDANGNLIDISLAVEQHNYMKVIRDDVSEDDLARRQMVLDFIENFRTAYNRKDVDYLDQIYSEDALIITGKVVKVKPQQSKDSFTKSLGAAKVEYLRQTKAEYITNLKRIFKNNKCINIRFEDISVRKHARRNKIYGVQLKQYWASDHYSDVGYLFLMINFEDDELNPTIEVRTWQPTKIGEEDIRRDEIISLDNFRL